MSIVTEEMTELTIEEVTQMALVLWPHCNYKEEFEDFSRILTSPTETSFLAKDGDLYAGFITLSLRSDYVEGATSSPVGYIEGIFVKPEFRKSGVGKLLVERGETWANAQGCKDYCSDAEIINHASIKFHNQVGFKEVNRVACFSKRI